MKILFVVPYVPNLIRVRPYNFIRSLSKRGHQVTVLAVCTNARETQDAQWLTQYCPQVFTTRIPRWRSWWNCLWALASSKPLQTVYSWQRNLLTWVSVGNFDVIHVEHLRGSQYGLELKRQLAKLEKPPPLVWDSVDCISLLFRQAVARSHSRMGRLAAQFELRRTERYEGWLLEQFDRILVTTKFDRDTLLALLPAGKTAPITVVPNGVDLHHFRMLDEVVREPATIVISGKMSYHANVTMVLHFVKDIMPYVWAKRPDTKLQIVGKDPTRNIRQLAENPLIVVTGAVRDVRPYLQKATLAVAPIVYGAGMQNKVLEALACATPTICTPQAISALNVIPGRDVIVGHEPKDFAEGVVKLLNDGEQQREIGQAGRRYVEEHHNWDNVAAHLESIYNEFVSATH